eukprot:gene36809-10532_t
MPPAPPAAPLGGRCPDADPTLSGRRRSTSIALGRAECPQQQAAPEAPAAAPAAE